MPIARRRTIKTVAFSGQADEALLAWAEGSSGGNFTRYIKGLIFRHLQGAVIQTQDSKKSSLRGDDRGAGGPHQLQR